MEDVIHVTGWSEGVELFNEMYTTPRQIVGNPAYVTGELEYGISKKYQTIRVRVGVELPVEASIEEIKQGQHLALSMARKKILTILPTLEKDLDNMIDGV